MSTPSFTSRVNLYLSQSFFDTATLPGATALRLPLTDLFTKLLIGFISVMAAAIELIRYINTHSISDIFSPQPN